MDFKSVYRVLMDVFPQVDARILRAVAIENSKDADKAVKVVLMEVIPCIASTSGSANDSLKKASFKESMYRSVSKVLDEGFSGVSVRDNGNGNGDQEFGYDGKQVVSPVELSNPLGPRQSAVRLSTIVICDDAPSNLRCLVESNPEQLCSNVASLDINTSAVKFSSPAVLAVPSHVSEGNFLQTNDEVSEETYFSNVFVDYSTITEVIDYEHEPMQKKSTHELDLEHEVTDDISKCEVVELVAEHALDTEVSRSGQICRVDLLEDIIKDARDNKKTLFSAMESVMSLMREMELKEKAAEQVKEEAARGPLDILASVKDLKQMLLHAREANDMHAGEVYGEKAILATEVKELQSRLLCLSDERDNSLAILDEMRQTLEQRLDVAEKEMKAAEQEKIEKEECARNALADQQRLMDKLVQESKLLKQESEENSKLQEFLMNRGSVVDALQGEISVICQDVKLLKQKFDEKVPLSESFSSSQTSCRLASSSSSLKNSPIDQVPMQIETALETLKQASPVSSINEHFSSAEEVEAKNHDTQVDDDGWEFCDKKELNM